MNQYLQEIYQKWAGKDITKGILLIDNHEEIFDLAFLVLAEVQEKSELIESYSFDHKKFFLIIVPESLLKDTSLTSLKKKIMEWLVHGKIIFDRNNHLQQLIQDTNDFLFNDRKVKSGIEFAELIYNYQRSKTLYKKRQFLDAYTHLIHTFHHLGRLTMIENGYHPDLMNWNRIKEIEPELYKIYKELVHNYEHFMQRMELIYLTSEFFIHNKTELGAAHLIETLLTKEQWSLQEILNHPEFRDYSFNIISLIEYLVEKNYIFVHHKAKECLKRYYIYSSK